MTNIIKINYKLITVGGLRIISNLCNPVSKSSRHNNRNNCDAALCSDGNKFGLHVISSKNVIACERKAESCSKS